MKGEWKVCRKCGRPFRLPRAQRHHKNVYTNCLGCHLEKMADDDDREKNRQLDELEHEQLYNGNHRRKFNTRP